jgi:hypothetical protein
MKLTIKERLNRIRRHLNAAASRGTAGFDLAFVEMELQAIERDLGVIREAVLNTTVRLAEAS